ncbi:MAG: helix-turn-helix domain-containing protein [Ruminococcus sp.]|nr:helix-turn-helix domain-containing protein [Ruminococcus sp.]
MISRNLKYLRRSKGFSQEELSERVGVSRQTVAKWESGESLPDISKCAELAMLYGVSLDAIVSCPLEEQTESDLGTSEGNYIFGIVKVGERGQVVIPKHARSVYDITPGDKLLVVGDKRGMAFAKIKGLSDFDLGK